MNDHTRPFPKYCRPASRRVGRSAVLLLALALLVPARAAYAQTPGSDAASAAATPEGSLFAMSCGGAGQVSSGFVVQTGLGGRLATLATLATTMTPDTGAGFEWNLLVGYKIRRVVLGVHLDLLASSPAGAGSTVTTAFLLAPEVQFALARSADRRAELIGVVNLGIGETGSFFRFSTSLAPGVRYWVHRNIALNSMVGLSGDVILQDRAGQTALISIFGNVGVLGAF